ncbi:MAG: hypothetical protein ACRDH6_01845 [Actinomycetota bacterium]
MRASVIGMVALALAMVGASSGSAQNVASFSAAADTTGFDLDLAGSDVLTFGVSHADVDSTPQSNASGDGFVESGLAQVTCSGNATDASTGIGPGQVGDPSILEVNLGIPTADCATTLTPLSATGSGALAEVGVSVGVPDVLRAAVDLSVMKGTSTASSAAPGTVNSEAVVSQVDLAVTLDAVALADTLEDPVCTGLAGLPAIGGTLEPICRDLFTTVRGDTELLRVTVLPARATCAFDGQKATAEGDAAIVTIRLLGQELSIRVGQTITLLEGTPLEITIGLGVVTTEGNGTNAASARAQSAFIELLNKTIVLVLSDAACTASGAFGIGVPPERDVPLPVTGTPILPLLAGGSAMAAGAFGIRRFLKR